MTKIKLGINFSNFSIEKEKNLQKCDNYVDPELFKRRPLKFAFPMALENWLKSEGCDAAY